MTFQQAVLPSLPSSALPSPTQPPASPIISSPSFPKPQTVTCSGRGIRRPARCPD